MSEFLFANRSAGECSVPAAIRRSKSISVRTFVFKRVYSSGTANITPGVWNDPGTSASAFPFCVRDLYNGRMEPTCPICHVVVRPTDFYCYNCGRNLHAKPLPTGMLAELACYAGSLLLPPFGLWWGMKYIKQDGAVSKRIGWMSIVLTILASVIVTVLTVRIFQGINMQVQQQLQMIEGL